MGLIREPKNVDFTVLDKPWTEEERRELSAYIKMRKDLNPSFTNGIFNVGWQTQSFSTLTEFNN